MRVLIPLILVLVIAVVVLTIYAIHLRRQIKESDNPLLALTRKQRRAVALDQINQDANERNLDWQNRLDQTIYGNTDRRDSK